MIKNSKKMVKENKRFLTQNVIKETKTRKTMSRRRKSVINNKGVESLSQTQIF